MPESKPQPEINPQLTPEMDPKEQQAAAIFDKISQAQEAAQTPEDWDKVLELHKELDRLYNPEAGKEAEKKESEQPAEIKEKVADWQKFYKEELGLDVDLSKVRIPERTAEQEKEFTRLIVVVQGMTPQFLFDKCKALFPSSKYTNEDLNKVIKPDRIIKDKSYAIWVRDRVEADEENKNRSANYLKDRGTTEITLEERLLYELKYFKETGEHLDTENYTLCAGSRRSRGDVPSVYWGWRRVQG